ncbi:uncharacterized protein LOC6548361 [Drosophila erecta]|uniref:Nucleoporin NUP35 n=1 Tax=Drosophila erecta TaxID=7220 RepID=B3NKR0_DROER|nr:uncharacterized protein LOC6548361 [Drosophila erecta]EDV54364.1 uncharacterized protein Dere_GG21348 [Drosophila erecta]
MNRKGENTEHAGAYFSRHSEDRCLPTCLGEPIIDALSRKAFHQVIGINSDHTIPDYTKKYDEEPRNTFWISVSDYQLDKAYMVYRFFHDIGGIVAQSLTKTNRMYLRYFSMEDSQIALSYDGQKIGYGGDIRVKVRAENHVTENSVTEFREQCSECNGNPTDNKTTETAIVYVEDNKDEKLICDQLKMGNQGENKSKGTNEKVCLSQWFKEKLSYVFYFY